MNTKAVTITTHTKKNNQFNVHREKKFCQWLIFGRLQKKKNKNAEKERVKENSSNTNKRKCILMACI